MTSFQRFFRILKAVMGISTSSMFAYRSNLFFFFIFETGFTLATFASVGLGVKFAGGSIAGWDEKQIFLLTAMNAVTHHLFLCFGIGGVFGIPYDIAEGRMDFVLLKPLHPLLSMFATHEFTISNLPNLAISLGVLGYFSSQAIPEFGFMAALCLGAFILCGFLLRLAIAIVILSPAFMAERLLEAESLFWNSISLSRFPRELFPRALQWIFSTFFPHAVVCSVPAEILLRKPLLMPAGFSLGVVISFFALTVWFFDFCRKRYQSVNIGM